MKTAIYVRVSTRVQDYQQQIEACKNYCRIKGWKEVDVFKEKESSVKARPVFDELLRLAKTGHYGVILVYRLDRAWRRSYKFIMDYEGLKNRGIKVVSVMEGLDPTTPIGEASMTIIMALAQLERDNISLATRQRLDAIKEMNKDRIEKGLPIEKRLGRKPGAKDRDKRSVDGYKTRWAKLKGGKIETTITPEHIDLKTE